MKGGQTPIHIMRLAPADLVNDPVVKLQLAKHDFAAVSFYVLVMFWSHIEGGDLPADIEALAAVIGMPKRVVARVLPIWLKAEKLFIEDTCLYNRRVRREVHEELAFRSEQQELGKVGAKKRWRRGTNGVPNGGPMPTPKGNGKGANSPPSPAPSPAPTPVGTEEQPPAYSPSPAARTETAIREKQTTLEGAVCSAASRIGDRTGRDPPGVVKELTAYVNKAGVKIDGRYNPAGMSIERLEKSLADAEAWLSDLDKADAKKRASA